MDISRFIVTEDMTVRQVMECINNNVRGTAFVCRDGVLLAAVSDGDIRRYLIRQGNLEEKIGKIANYNPVWLPVSRKAEATEVMKTHAVAAVPLLDDMRRVVDIKLLVDYKYREGERIDAPLVIMAGGKGTRLKPYTDILPKPLIPVGDKPIVEHIMDRFQEYECAPVYMIVNYMKNFIRAYFTDEKQREIRFIEEEEFLGTGGGLKLLDGLLEKSFFMTNCDILVDADYADIMEYHRKNGNIITIVCAKKEITVPYGTVTLDGQGFARELVEKPTYSFHTSTGLYVIEPAFLKRIPAGRPVQITDTIRGCIEEGGRVGVYLIDEERWMDMGQLEELEKMRERLDIHV